MFKDVQLTAPTKYKQKIDDNKRYKDKLDKIIFKRDSLMEDKARAEKRDKEITIEMIKLNGQLKRLLDKELIEGIKEDVKLLQKEQKELKDILNIEIKEVIKDLYINSDIEALKQKAQEEHLEAQTEVLDYWKVLRSMYNDGLLEYAMYRDYNMLKVTSKAEDNLKTYILEG